MRSAIAGLALLLIACGSTAAQSEPEVAADQPLTASLGQPFELAVGGSAVVTETGLQVTMTAVPEDSRCPPDVTCVWAGRVSVAVQALAPGDTAPQDAVLSTCCGTDASSATYAGQMIQLKAISPGAAPSGQGIAEQDYRGEFLVVMN